MSDFRESSAVIREAELLAGSAEVAASWVEHRSSQSIYASNDGDEKTEAALLAMGSRRIDLALARFGRNPEVLRQLYERGDPVLRAATLSNQPHMREAMFDPWVFTGETRDDLAWLADLADVEFQALFANPALSDSYLSDFFEQKGAWTFLSDERRREAIAWVTRNILARKKVDDWDGWASYSHSKVFDAAWRLAALVPTTSPWAATLSRLYDGLPAEQFSKYDAIEAAGRWFPAEDDENTWNDEERYKERGYFTSYQRVRVNLARLAAAKATKAPRADLLLHPDVAVRCGALMVLKLDPAGVTEAIERDGVVAAEALIENEDLWRKEATRQVLREACWALPDPQSTMLVPQSYRRQEDIMRKRSPRFFADEDRVPEDVSEASLPNDVALLRDQIRALQASVQDTRRLLIVALLGGLAAYLTS